MLVLGRRQGEKIHIYCPGETTPIVITLCQWNRKHGGTAEIGIEASARYKIFRAEIEDQRKEKA